MKCVYDNAHIIWYSLRRHHHTEREGERGRERARACMRARGRSLARDGTLARERGVGGRRGVFTPVRIVEYKKKRKTKNEEGEVTLHFDEYTIKHTIKNQVTSTTFPNARSIRLRALGKGLPPSPPPAPLPQPHLPRPRTVATKKRRLSVRSSVLKGARPHGQYRSCLPSDSYLGPVEAQVMLIISNVNNNFL